jgi:hypothetical protein
VLLSVKKTEPDVLLLSAAYQIQKHVLLFVKKTEPDVFALECCVADSETRAAVCEKKKRSLMFLHLSAA